ncbi:testicular acid phosphatase homolog [Anoplophora glabripennis]|uniref:testicular acid phosphatase homolog n=1 Tax=Anoplophora glabripennis TaxID=217634 RepID=UPI000873F855|nr:testicular acid phosphatase homolog [Anoplophora glabripennis]
MFKIFLLFFMFTRVLEIFCYYQNGDLRFVAVLYRHGDRAPTKIYPKDPYNDVSYYWPDGLGELTNLGIQHQYELGQWFTNRYATFLPEKFSTADIYVRSSDRDRTLMSAAANLAGLYPAKGAQVWDKQLLWRPIPIHTVPNEEDEVVAMKKDCPRYNLLYDQLLNSRTFQLVNLRNKPLYDYLTKNTGWNITELRQIETLYSLLSIEKQYNLTLPAWAEGIFPKKLEFLAALSHASFSFTKPLARLKNGPFFDYVFSHFDKVTSNATVLKFLMISAHDNTIVNLLSAMGVYDYTFPNFASTIIWELSQKDERFYVNLFYKNTATVSELKLMGCEMNCEYETFKTILEPVTVKVEEWNKDCII